MLTEKGASSLRFLVHGWWLSSPPYCRLHYLSAGEDDDHDGRDAHPHQGQQEQPARGYAPAWFARDASATTADASFYVHCTGWHTSVGDRGSGGAGGASTRRRRGER